MNGSREVNRKLLSSIQSAFSSSPDVDIAVCPPAVFVSEIVSVLEGTDIRVGGQDCSDEISGAFTGETSAPMLVELGCRYVLVGHSERRARQNESSLLVAKKFIAAQAAGLVPILCLGEQRDDRESGKTESVIAEQLDAVLNLVGIEAFYSAVIAYEPVWAIGTGLTASPQQAEEVHAFIRSRIAQHDAQVANQLRILYGGSVKADNAEGLFALPDIDGGLIGGASLDSVSFNAIVNAAISASRAAP